MLTFLFGNLQKKALTSNIVSFAQNHDVDVFIFAECILSDVEILTTLNQKDHSEYFPVATACEKIAIFTKFPDEFMTSIEESDRLTIQHLQLPGSQSMLVAATHFVEKYNWDEFSQNAECVNLAEGINRAEEFLALVKDLRKL